MPRASSPSARSPWLTNTLKPEAFDCLAMDLQTQVSARVADFLGQVRKTSRRSRATSTRHRAGSRCAGILGRIHCGVGMAQQRVDLVAMLREERDTDTHRNIDRMLAVDNERLAQRLQHLLATAAASCALLMRCKRITNSSPPTLRHGIGLPRHHRAQTIGNLLQQQIADIVPQRIIDRLKPVEVDEQHRQFAAVAPRRRPAPDADGRSAARGWAGR